MAEERLDARDWRVLLAWILAGILGVTVAYRYFFQAFPEAALNLKVSRPQATELARGFLAAQGQKLDGYQSSIIFSVDDNAKTYLEREMGLEQANRIMASEINIWWWEVRFFRPLQKEEFSVRVSPAGRVVGFTHELEEAREGAHLDREAARAAAEDYLRAQYAAEFSGYYYLPEEANSKERPKRLDWSFTWERRGFKAKDAPYRLKVSLLGDKVGGSREFLKVPEAWERSYERLRSSNLLYQWAAQVPYFFLQIVGVVLVLYFFARRGVIRWRGAMKLGLVLAALFFAMEANNWPILRAGYDTNTSYSAFFARGMLLAVLVGLAAGLVVALTVAAAEPLYRRNQPNQLRLASMFRLPGIRSKEFFRSCVIGLSLAAAHIGFVVLFYLIGSRYGVWAPQEIKYTDVASTALPWLYPLTIGIYAATSEEFLFRLFAIPLLHRLTRSRFIAVVVPAFVWGFLHSAYPQQPGYIRGIEVGAIGIVAGLVMLRWGILATLVWHYTVDAMLISLFLLRSESLYFRVSGAIVGAAVLIPLVISGGSYLLRRRFEADPALLNAADPVVEAAPPAEAVAAPSRAYEALTPRTMGILVACGVAGLALVALVKSQAIGDFVRVQVNARQAMATADETLRRRGIDIARYRRATTIDPTYNKFANEYLRRQVGIAGANKLYQGKVPSVFWRVRYFRDSEKEEYGVVIRTDGALDSVHHTIEEKAPGANLSKEEAQARAEAYLRGEKKLDLTKWKLVEANSEKKPARTDHTLVWEELESIGEAHVRTEVHVLGDEVGGYRVFIYLPEQWLRKHSEETLWTTAYFWGRLIFFGVLAGAVLVLFIMNLKDPAAAGIPWRRVALWSLWAPLAMLVTYGNSVPQLLASYPTQWPFKTYAAILVIVFAFIAVAVYFGIFLAFGLAWFYLSRAFGSERLPSWTGMPSAYYRDAFLVALAGAGTVAGLSRLPVLVAWLWPTLHRAIGADVPVVFGTSVPAAEGIGSAVLGGLWVTAMLALASGFIAAAIRPMWQRVGLLAIVAVALAGLGGSPADFVKNVLLEGIVLCVVWWGVTRILRFNMLAYFLLSVTLTLGGLALELLRHGSQSFFVLNGYATIAALALFLLWPLVAWRTAASRAGAGSQGM